MSRVCIGTRADLSRMLAARQLLRHQAGPIWSPTQARAVPALRLRRCACSVACNKPMAALLFDGAESLEAWLVRACGGPGELPATRPAGMLRGWPQHDMRNLHMAKLEPVLNPHCWRSSQAQKTQLRLRAPSQFCLHAPLIRRPSAFRPTTTAAAAPNRSQTSLMR
jgi:hypothetical protein